LPAGAALAACQALEDVAALDEDTVINDTAVDAANDLENETLQIAVKAQRPALLEAVTVEAHVPAMLKPGAGYTLTLEACASQPTLFEFKVLDEQGSADTAKILIPVFAKPEWQHRIVSVVNRSAKPLKSFALAGAMAREAEEYTISLRNIHWQEGVAECGWTREFERGTVVVNPGMKPQVFTGLHGLRKILGKQDPVHNNGERVGERL